MSNIWTNGCFDILHIGHIRLFEYAKSLGDKLCVGIDSDNRVKHLKGNSRPINNQQDRKHMLQNIKPIDEVHIFETDNELKAFIKKLMIDTIVVGDDYKDRYVIGSELVNRVIFFPKIPNKSSSLLISSKQELVDDHR